MADSSHPLAQPLEAVRTAFADLINAGRRHLSANAYDEARAAFSRAAQLLPLHPQAYLERGSVRAVLGDVVGSVDDLGIALALSEPDEDVLRAHFNRGSALLEVRQAGRAVVHFEVTAEAGVDDARALLARARREAAQEGFDPRKAA